MAHKFDEHDENDDVNRIIAYIPSIDNVPLVGSKIEHTKSKITIYSPQQMRDEIRVAHMGTRQERWGMMMNGHFMRDKVYVCDRNLRPMFEGYVSHLENRNIINEGSMFRDHVVVRQDIELRIVGTI